MKIGIIGGGSWGTTLAQVLNGLLQLVSVWFQDLFHSPIRSTFHLSLTVLVHYRSLRSI